MTAPDICTPVAAQPAARGRRLPRALAGLALLAAGPLFGLMVATPAVAQPMPAHTVIVVLENKGFTDIIGNADAAYINSLVPQGALMTQSYGMGHPSQPNYLQLFSGSNQGVTDNSTPHAFSTPNLRSALAAQGHSFTGYSESLPSAGFTGSAFSTVPGQNQYERKHNPWVNWQGAASNAVPAAENQPFSAFPADYTLLPSVAIVVPDERHNMHDGSIAAGDAWLQANLQAYATWAQTHDSLLILTFDEDSGNDNNRIVTLLLGPMVLPGSYGQTVNHLNVLSTVAALYGAQAPGDAAAAAPILNVFLPVPEPGTWALAALGLPWIGWRVRRVQLQRRG